MTLLLRRPKAVIFDLFGTLVEEFTKEGFLALQARLFLRVTQDPRLLQLADVRAEHFNEEMAFQVNSRYRAAAASHGQSPDVRHAIADLLARIAPGIAVTDDAVACFIEHYAAEERLQSFEESIEVLQQCRSMGMTTALLSNVFFPGFIYAQQLAKFALAPLLDHLVFSSDLQYMKPHPEAFQAVIDLVGVPAADCLMIGDRIDLDIDGALGVGMPAVLIAAPEGVAPEGVPRIARLRELLPLLQTAGEYTEVAAPRHE